VPSLLLVLILILQDLPHLVLLLLALTQLHTTHQGKGGG
jgi:hypothetical protein